MQSAARVLIVGHSDSPNDNLAEALNSRGFESHTGDITNSAAELTGMRRPDIVVLNMNSPEAQHNPKAFFALARALKESPLSSRMRILLVGANRDLTLNGETDDIDDLLIGPVRSSQICHRIRSLVRLNTMHEELVRRLNTSAKYGVDAPNPVSPPRMVENATILFLGNAMGYGTIENALAKQATLVAALTFSTALDYLGREEFESIIIDAGPNPAPFLEFIRDLRRNSRLFNMPVLMLVDPGHILDPEEVYEAGVTDVLEKPVRKDELQVRAFALVREFRFRNSLRHIYTEAKHFATNDALTGLYSRGFLLEHLVQIISDTERTSQTFTLASFEISNMKQINSAMGYAAGDRVIRQVGEMMGLLVRGEDLAARYTGHKFMLVLPDTSSEQAKHAINRILGVVHFTEFAILGLHEPVKVTLHTGTAEYQKGDTPETLVAKAWP